MYYDKKSTFYFKQYGPAAVIIVISILLLAGGVFIYFKTANNNEPNNMANASNNVSVSSKPNYNVTDNIDDFNNLNTGEFSKEYQVIDVKDASTIIIDLGNNKVTEIKLIGIRVTLPETKGNNSLQESLDKIKSELIGKNIKLSFDTNKAENNDIYAYVYLNNILYNETILKNGCAELRPEKYNITKLDILLTAEKEAKANDVGIWQ